MTGNGELGFDSGESGSTREAPVTKNSSHSLTSQVQRVAQQLHGPGSKAQQAKDQQRPGLKTKPQHAPTVKPQQAQDPAVQAAEKSFAQLSKDKRPSQTDVTPYVGLYLNRRSHQHAVDLAEVNALTQTLLELAEETEIKINTLQEFAHCVLASGTREVCDEL